MNFFLGYIAGIVTAILVFAVLAYFRTGIEKQIKVVERELSNAGPKPKGAIFLPEDEADIARKEHVRKNKALGKDTPLADLYEK